MVKEGKYSENKTPKLAVYIALKVNHYCAG